MKVQKGEVKGYSKFSFLLSYAFAPSLETRELHPSTPNKVQSTLDYFYCGQAYLKIEALASSFTLKFQTDVPRKTRANTEKRFTFPDEQQSGPLCTAYFRACVNVKQS